MDREGLEEIDELPHCTSEVQLWFSDWDHVPRERHDELAFTEVAFNDLALMCFSTEMK
jgi:hypothetical protein